MKKCIILLSIIAIIAILTFLFVRTSKQEQLVAKRPVTKEETLEALKSILQEYGFANNMKDWNLDIDECCMKIEYEKGERKYRIVCPTFDVDSLEIERTGAIYMLCYQSDVASFTDLTDGDGYHADRVPFMYVDVPLTKEEIIKMIQRLGNTCEQAHARYYVVQGWLGLEYKISKHLISKVICVNCFTDRETDNVKEQYTNWYKSTYGDRFYNHMVEASFSVYEAESYEKAIKYRNDVLAAIRAQKETFEELEDHDFKYSCDESE